MSTVMVIDDSAFMRKDIKKILENTSYEVVAEASNGKDIVFKYEEHKPDIITMDLDMPEVDGLTALEALIKAYPEANVVVVSAQGQMRKVVRAINFGAKSYLVKPIEPKKLIEVFSTILK